MSRESIDTKTIIVDARLEKIFPKFMAQQKAELAALKTAAETGNIEELKRIGHRMSGSCGGFGLDRLGELGGSIERDASAGNLEHIHKQIQMMEEYFLSVKVEFKR